MMNIKTFGEGKILMSTIMATVFYLSGYNMKYSRWIRSKSSITLLLVPFVVAFFSSFSIFNFAGAKIEF